MCVEYQGELRQEVKPSWIVFPIVVDVVPSTLCAPDWSFGFLCFLVMLVFFGMRISVYNWTADLPFFLHASCVNNNVFTPH